MASWRHQRSNEKRLGKIIFYLKVAKLIKDNILSTFFLLHLAYLFTFVFYQSGCFDIVIPETRVLEWCWNQSMGPSVRIEIA